jgi:hypothetical protein
MPLDHSIKMWVIESVTGPVTAALREGIGSGW